MKITAKGGALREGDALSDRFRSKYWELKADPGRSKKPSKLLGTAALRGLKFDAVIAPLDGSPYAEHALPLAVSLAAAAKAPLEITSLTCDEAMGKLRRERMHSYLKELTGPIVVNSVEVSVRLRHAPLGMREMQRESALIVMAQRPRFLSGLFSRRASTERVLEAGPLPLVLTQGYRWPYSRRTAQRMKRMVVVLDGTAEAERVLPAAAAIAEANQARMTLLRVASGTPHYDTPSVEKEAEAREYLDTIADALRRCQILAEPAVWSSNESLCEVILSFAQNHNADLIAMTTSLRRLLTGAIRRQPVRYLVRRVPVLLVNSDYSRSRSL